MRNFLPLAIMIGGALAGWLRFVDETKEPPISATVTIDGVAQDITLGEEFELKIGGETVRAQVDIKPTRTMELPEFSFEYPTEMAFEYEGMTGLKMWTLDSSSVTIVVYEFDLEQSAESLLDELVMNVQDSLGIEDSQTVPISMEVADATLPGKRLEITMGDVALQQDFYAVTRGGDAKVTVMIQDSPDELGANTEEFKRIVSLFQKSFRWPH